MTLVDKSKLLEVTGCFNGTHQMFPEFIPWIRSHNLNREMTTTGASLKASTKFMALRVNSNKYQRGFEVYLFGTLITMPTEGKML